MTKVDAIRKLLEDCGGTASWQTIYQQIENYYPAAKRAPSWEAGLRGVVYRELRREQNFKKIGIGLFALKEFQEKPQPQQAQKIRMHAFMEGICLQLGKLRNFETYTADPAAHFQGSIQLKELATLPTVPNFTYPDVVAEAKRMDVIWFNQDGRRFPKRVFEIVDSPGTLTGAFNRCLQLLSFRTEFFIVAPQAHKARYEKNLARPPYNQNQNNARFRFVEYGELTRLYASAVETEQLENNVFQI